MKIDALLAAQGWDTLDDKDLGRCCVEDVANVEAQCQRMAARCLIESGRPLTVGKAVVLEFEPAMRGCYGCPSPDPARGHR